MCLKCHITVKHFFVYAKNVFTRTIYIYFVFTPPTTMIHRKVDIVFYFFFYVYKLYVFKQNVYSHQILICLNVSGIHVKKPLQNSWRTTGFLNLGVIYASFLTGRNLLINKKDKNSRYTNIKYGDNSMHKTNNLKKNLIDKAK